MASLLSIEELDASKITSLLSLGAKLKSQRGDNTYKPLQGQTWALIFSKSSTRTRVSFETGIHELGGNPMFLSINDIQLGRGEPVKDTARVLGRMIHGIIIRTYEQSEIEEFSHFAQKPVINALTDAEHPCQILADLLTVQEKLGGWQNKKICFVGDGFNNMACSWMWAAKHLGFEFWIAAPKAYQPPAEYMQRLNAPNVHVTTDVAEAVKGAHVINTDVWLSMGQEHEGSAKEQHFLPYQVNAELLQHADAAAIVLHCLPAYRGKEISEEVLEAHADVIFQQAENRLHVQKAVMVACVEQLI